MKKSIFNKNSIEKSIKILEYKLLFQEKEKVFLEFEEGSIDLGYRLSFFEKRLDKTVPNQTTIFNEKILNTPKLPDNVSLSDKGEVDSSNNNLYEKKEKDEPPSYIKKLYRKIANVTHPDKTRGINSKEIIDNYTSLYQLSVSAIEENNYQDILMIANDLSIDISSVDDKTFNDLFEKSIENVKKEILGKKKLLGYQWYHIPENKKNDHLKTILLMSGFIFTNEKVQEVVKSQRPVSSRKVGQRPKKGVFARRTKRGNDGVN